MRNLFTTGLLFLAFTVYGQAPPIDTTNRVAGKIPEIESIAIFGPPLIFGGYSFYADRKGRLIHQSIKRDDEKKFGYVEERLVLRQHPELFAKLVADL